MGAMIGLKTGPGMLVTAAMGACIGGLAGYVGAKRVADATRPTISNGAMARATASVPTRTDSRTPRAIAPSRRAQARYGRIMSDRPVHRPGMEGLWAATRRRSRSQRSKAT